MELLIPIFGIVFGLCTPVIVVYLFKKAETINVANMYKTIESALEKGVELPSSLLEAINKPAIVVSNLKHGLIWSFLGLGILLSWTIFRNFNEASLGFIPLFVGIAYLITDRIERMSPDS